MTIWDHGTYELHKWEAKKVEVTFHGERLTGRYGLFPIGKSGDAKDDWMIHRMDPPADPDREPMPERLVPMMARPSDTLPPDELGWSFEVKWDGVRAIAYMQPGRLRLESRNLNDITEAYPEVRGLIGALGMHEAVLDGEIVAFDENGRPSFERLQRRMHVRGASAIRRLQSSLPVMYAIFDLLYLDGHSLIELPYRERRERLESLELSGPAWRVPAVHPGEGKLLLEATAKQGLEGIVAKRLECRYEPGRRSGNWLKIKHTMRQELVVGGWVPGEGRRTKRIGALLMGYYEDGSFVYAGRVGTGFTEKTLDQLQKRLEPLRRDHQPVRQGAQAAPGGGVRGAVAGGRDRAARVDGRADHARALVQGAARGQVTPRGADRGHRRGRRLGRGRHVRRRSELARGAVRRGRAPRRRRAAGEHRGPRAEDHQLGQGALSPDRLHQGRPGRLLRARRARRASASARPAAHPQALPQRRRAAVLLREAVTRRTARSGCRPLRINEINYTLAQDRPTLIWLANLADVELHTSLSLAQRPERPTMMVFDLDPGPPAGILECCEVGLVLHGLFEQLGLESLAKTSGSKGLQVYVPLNTPVDYRATKPFAKRVAEVLEQRMPELVVSRMTKRLRPGKVLVDWSQNDEHKTTANVYSLRARERPTVSTPVSWDEVAACRERGDAGLLTFEADELLDADRAAGGSVRPGTERQAATSRAGLTAASMRALRAAGR